MRHLKELLHHPLAVASARVWREHRLRKKTLEGSQDFAELSALADRLLGTPGRELQGLAVLEQVLALPIRAQKRAVEAADMAWRYYELGRQAPAVRLAEYALSLLPADLEEAEDLLTSGLAHAVLASCHHCSDGIRSASEAGLGLEAFRELTNRYPEDPAAAKGWRFAAGLHVLRENFAEAVLSYRNALAADRSGKNQLHVQVCMGNVLRLLGEYGQSEEHLREALSVVGADKRMLPRIHYEFGKTYRASNRSPRALASFEQAAATLTCNPALRRDDGFVGELNWELGDLYYHAGRYADAGAAMRAAVSKLPDSPLRCDALVTLSHCYFHRGQLRRAGEGYRQVVASERATTEQRAVAEKGLTMIGSWG